MGRSEPVRSEEAGGASRDDDEADWRLADRAYKELEQLIVTTALPPGEWVTETSLGQRMGFSRTPIREAVQKLARAGLIQVVPRRGLRITSVRVEDQLRVLEFRRQVEHFLTTSAARRATHDERERFGGLSAEMRQCAVSRDQAEHFRIDFEYKVLLVRAAGNEFAGDAIGPLWASSRRFAWVTRASRDIGLSSRLVADVMKAIADGDVEAAASANEAYMSALETLARRSIDAVG